MDTQKYLTATDYIDFESEAVQKLIEEFKSETDKKKIAVGLYYKIRDSYRYNPYNIAIKPEKYKASHVAQKQDGHCIDKSILLVACLRALGIPARLQLAKVRNHIGIEKFVEIFGTDEITPHGMVNLYLNDKWLKVSPAFNKGLCDHLNVENLEFDGENDSIFHAFDKEGGKFMEYIEDYGHFEDVPFDFILRNFAEHYPKFIGMVDHKTGSVEIK